MSRPLGPWAESSTFRTPDDHFTVENCSPYPFTTNCSPSREIVTSRTGCNQGRHDKDTPYDPAGSTLDYQNDERGSLSGTYRWIYDGAWMAFSGLKVSAADPVPIPDDVKLEVSREAALKMADKAQGGMNTTSILGGFGQNVAMVSNAVFALGRGFNNVVRQTERSAGSGKRFAFAAKEEQAFINSKVEKVRTPGTSLKDLREHSPVFAVGDKFSNAYLEYTYGLKPAIGDFTSSIQGLAQQFANVPHARRFTGWMTWNDRYVVDREHSSVGPPPGFPSDPGRYYWTEHTTVSRFFKAKYGCWEKLSTENPLISLYQLGLTPDTVLTGLWDLIPYSFLLDYFYDVSGMLSLSMFPQGAFRGQWHLTYERYEVTTDYIAVCNNANSWCNHSLWGGRSTKTIVRFSRQPGLWTPAVERPHLRLPGDRQARNMLALGISAVTSTASSPIWQKTA